MAHFGRKNVEYAALFGPIKPSVRHGYRQAAELWVDSGVRTEDFSSISADPNGTGWSQGAPNAVSLLCHQAVMMRYNPVMDGYLTLRQATEHLRLKDSSGLRHGVCRGQLRTERVGHLHVTTLAWLEAYTAHVQAHRGGRDTPRGPRRPQQDGPGHGGA